MDLMLPILIAVIVVLVVYSISRVAADPAKTARKKLALRLSTEGRNDPLDALARPIVRKTEIVGLPPWLVRQAFMQTLNHRLILAYAQTSINRFLMIVGIAAVVVGGAALLVSANPLIGLAGAAGGGYVPFFLLARKRAKRQRLLGDQLPEALDFLSRILKAGHSFSTGLQMMSDELPKPLAGEFRRCYDQHSLGQSLEDALKDTATRIESLDFAFFVTAVLIQRSSGGDLSEVLKNISTMIRGRMRLQQHVKSKTAEGRFTGYVLVAFPAVLFFITYYLNPEYGGKLLHGTGLKLLFTALGLQTVGLYCIKKITTVRV